MATAFAMLALALPCLHSQTAAGKSSEAATGKITTVTSLRMVQEKDGPAVEILSTQPLTPSIQAISGPPRIVIDLPNARLDVPKQINLNIKVHADQISGMRANQFQQNPPIARVVIDMEAPRPYTWDAVGNRLMVHLAKNPADANEPSLQKPTDPSLSSALTAALTSAPQPVVASVRAPGPLAVASNSNNGGAGSVIAAGAETATVNLSSGGDVQVCPGTTVSVTPSENRHNILLSLNTGALQTHLALDASADAVLTPDFRIMLAGPGQFNYAISADSQGNTCMRALPGNTAAAVVTELLGDRTYQVKATDQLVFRAGQLDHVDMAVPLECGCPPPRPAPLRADNNLPLDAQPPNGSQSNPLPRVDPHPASNSRTSTAENAPSAATAPLGVSEASNELKVEISAPFVFHAPDSPPAPVATAKALPVDSRSPGDKTAPDAPATVASTTGPAQPSGTDPATQPPHRGFFKKIGAFFSSIFH